MIRNKPFFRCWDFWLLIGLLALVNYPLILGGNTDRWAFYPGPVKEGEWWRIITCFLPTLPGTISFWTVRLFFWSTYPWMKKEFSAVFFT